MGVVAILTDAVGWAVTGTFLTATLARIDALSVAALRTVFATLFVLPAMFVLGAQGDFSGMGADIMWKLAVGGLGAYVLAEPTYALTLSFLGLTRGYTAVIGLFSLFSFILPALFLDESIGGRSAAGGALVIAGVYVVARYGRAMSLAVAPAAIVPPAIVPPATVAPATVPPATVPPATVPPATVPPATVPPATVPPATVPPATVPPATVPPATVPPATVPPAILGRQPQLRPPPVSFGARAVVGGALIIAAIYVIVRYGRAMSPAARPTATVPPVILGRRSPRGRFPFRQRVPPIAGGATTAAIPPARVRIPGLGLTLPRMLAGGLLAIVTGLAWAGDATLLRAVSPGLDAAPVALMQVWPAAVVFVLWLSIARRRRVFPAGLKPRTAGLIGVTGALTTGLGTILVVVAVQDIGAGPTAVLFSMSTVFALSLGVIFLKERVTRWGVLGAAVSVGGVALLAI